MKLDHFVLHTLAPSSDLADIKTNSSSNLQWHCYKTFLGTWHQVPLTVAHLVRSLNPFSSNKVCSMCIAVWSTMCHLQGFEERSVNPSKLLTSWFPLTVTVICATSQEFYKSETYTVSWPKPGHKTQANCHIIASEGTLTISTAAWNCCSHNMATTRACKCES